MYGERRRYTGFCWGNPREEDHLEDPGIDGRIILKWIFMTGLMWLRKGTGGGHLSPR